MPRTASSAVVVGANRLPRTVEAFLTTSLQALLEAGGGLLEEEEQALQSLQQQVAEYAPPVIDGSQLWEQLSSCPLLQTGCQGLDTCVLRNGMRGGQMVEVCGDSASGKTQLCLSAAALAARSGKRVVYVDTSNALRARRLREVAEAQAAAGVQPNVPGAMAPDPLKFVEVRRCYDAHALLATLDELMAQHAAQQAAQQAQQAAGTTGDVRMRQLADLPVSLLIVDALSALIAPILGGGQHSQGHALLAAAAVSLKSFAAATQAVVLVTNHLVGGSDEQRHQKRPAMGESWRNQPHTRIQLWRPPPGSSSGEGGGQGQGIAVLRSSTTDPPGALAPYALGPAGITDPADSAGPAGGGQHGAQAMQM